MSNSSSPISIPRWSLWILGVIFLVGMGIAIGILGVKFLSQSQNQSQVSSYQDCLAAKDSIVSRSYPSVCITVSGQRFTQSISEPTLSPSVTSVQEDDLTADWKTYTNKKHTYSIKLPQGWQPDRGYPDGQYSNEQLQTLDSTTWFKNSSIFSVQVLFECSSTTDVCFKKHQSDADKTGGPYTTKIRLRR